MAEDYTTPNNIANDTAEHGGMLIHDLDQMVERAAQDCAA